MEQIAIKPPRQRRTHNQIKQLLLQFEKDTLTVAEFCAIHSVSKATFHKWQSRYGIKSAKSAVAGGFAKLKIASPGLNLQHSLFAEVNGIKLYQPVAASYLMELFRL